MRPSMAMLRDEYLTRQPRETGMAWRRRRYWRFPPSILNWVVNGTGGRIQRRSNPIFFYGHFFSHGTDFDCLLRDRSCFTIRSLPFFSERIDATTRLADLTTFVQDNISPLLIETGRVTLPFSRESPPLLPSTHLHSLLALGCPSSRCNCAHLTSAAALSIRALAANFLLLK